MELSSDDEAVMRLSSGGENDMTGCSLSDDGRDIAATPALGKPRTRAPRNTLARVGAARCLAAAPDPRAAMGLSSDDEAVMHLSSGGDSDMMGCGLSDDGRDVTASSALGKTRTRAPRNTLPTVGEYRDGNVLASKTQLRFHQPLSLNIVLRQVGDAAQVADRRSVKLLLAPGDEPFIQRYGSLRATSVTHVAGKALTSRNCRELATILKFDVDCVAAHSPERWKQLQCVSPEFAEWFMGVPRGWTSPMPIVATARAHIIREHPHRRQKHSTLSLFSGCGALDFGLSPWLEPVAYCELDGIAAAVLAARCRDGFLPVAPIFPDVNRLDANDLKVKVDGIVAGFPCQDLSVAGSRSGLSGARSGLFFQVLRLCDVTACKFVFLENVGNIRPAHPKCMTSVDNEKRQPPRPANVSSS
jgi:hypothetical protein